MVDKVIKRNIWNIITQSLLPVLLGAALLIWPKTTTTTMVYFLGGYLALMGIVGVVSYLRNKEGHSIGALIGSAVMVVLALAVFIFPTMVASVFSVLLGLLLLLGGIVNMLGALEIKKNGKSSWLAVLMLNLLVVVSGILVIANPFGAAALLVKMIGIFLIVGGVIDIVTYLIFRSSLPE